jgi:hypothetical protein
MCYNKSIIRGGATMVYRVVSVHECMSKKVNQTGQTKSSYSWITPYKTEEEAEKAKKDIEGRPGVLSVDIEREEDGTDE